MRLLQGVMFVIFAAVSVCAGNPDAKRLYDDLLSNYNKLVRPVVNVTDALTVRIKLKLSQLIDVTWYDYKLKWEPKEYGGVELLHVPSDHIWRPDIVLYNNADGNFEVTLATKATLNYTGRVEWRPPAIYKSSCEIDVEYFPFDEQTCVMKFGSWTYDGFQVDLRHIDEINGTNIVEVGVDLSEFYTSVEWDILEVPAVRNEKFYTCCDEPYLDITFNITMRRKTLFYTVNLIIPCMGISFLTILVFYLPSDSGEKVSLSISILLSLTVFFLLLAEIIPPTSLVVPLLGKFVLFTMILDTFSIWVTVIVLNVHFRSPQTHTMAPWIRTLFINHLPKLLVMRRPIYQPLDHFSAASRRFMLRTCNGLDLRDHHIPPLPPNVALANFDPSLLLDHHLLDERNLETLSINTCKLHGSPKMGSTSISPHHHLLHHHHHHHSHHRLQSLDLMDDIPLPFQTDNYTTSPITGVLPSLIDHPPLPPPPPVTSHLLHLQQQQQQQLHAHHLYSNSNNINLNSVNLINNNNLINNTSNNINNNNNSLLNNTTNVIINNDKTTTTTPIKSGATPLIDGISSGAIQQLINNNNINNNNNNNTNSSSNTNHNNFNINNSNMKTNTSNNLMQTVTATTANKLLLGGGAVGGAGDALAQASTMAQQTGTEMGGVSGAAASTAATGSGTSGAAGGAGDATVPPCVSGAAGESKSALRNRWHTCPELHKAMDGVTYIADHTKKEEESTRVKEDWKFVAMVLDRLFLWIFTIAVVVGTAGIILQAPTLYDTRVPIDIKMSAIASTTAKPYISPPVL